MRITFEWNNLDWLKLWVVVGTVTVVWSGLGAVIPQKWYMPTMTVLSAIQAGFTFAMRAGKFVKDRQTVPGTGENP